MEITGVMAETTGVIETRKTTANNTETTGMMYIIQQKM